MGPATSELTHMSPKAEKEDPVTRLFARYSTRESSQPSAELYMALASFVRVLRDARLMDSRLSFTQARRAFRTAATGEGACLYFSISV